MSTIETTTAIQAIPQPDPERSNLDRLAWQEKTAAANGFALPATFFAVGTNLIDVGREKYRQSRETFENLPPARVALKGLTERIQAEEREDHTHRVRDLEMLPTGELHRRGGSGRVLLTPGSLGKLLARTGFKEPGAAAAYLANIPPDRRAREVNMLLGDAVAKDGTEPTAVLRTRNAIGHAASGLVPRECYAVVSERYTTGYEVSTLADIMSDESIFPGDARAVVEYDGHRGTIRLVWHSDIQPDSVRVGEVYQAYASITTRDDGTASLDPSAGLLRAVCINLTSMDAVIKLGTKRHTGQESVRRFIAKALQSAVSHVRDFARAWDSARAQAITIETVRDVPTKIASLPDGGRLALTEGTFRGLLKTGALNVPGFRGEDAVKELSKAFRKEAPEMSRAGVVNAITRAAHESELRGPWAAAEMEAQAGAILASPRPFTYVERGSDF